MPSQVVVPASTRSVLRRLGNHAWGLLHTDPLPPDLHGEIEQEILEITAVVRRSIRDEMCCFLQSHMDKAIRQSFLSRYQTIRRLIASRDERYQTIAVRTPRLEDTLSELPGSTRAVSITGGDSEGNTRPNTAGMNCSKAS